MKLLRSLIVISVALILMPPLAQARSQAENKFGSNTAERLTTNVNKYNQILADTNRELCPVPQEVEGASLRSRTFRSSDGFEFQLPANYRVMKLFKDSLAIVDNFGYRYIQCLD